jgi:hypothetical protein
MTDATVSSTPPRKRRWLRVAAWIVGILVVLVVAAYLIATSSAFLKAVILPRVSAALDADVTVGSASIHPFKEVVLRDLKVQAKGQEPIVTAPEVRARYSLMDIIGGNLHISEVTLESPTVSLVQNPDGTSNLDPLLKALSQKPAAPKPQPSGPSKPPRIDLGKFALNHATIRQVKNYAGGHRDVLELTNVTVTLENLGNGRTGRLALNAELHVADNPPAPAPAGLLDASIKGSYDFALTGDLKPATVKGGTRLEVSRAEGAFNELSAFSTALNCDVTPAEVREVALRFEKGGTPLGELVVNGPLDLEKLEGRLDVRLQGIDRRLLNLAGSPAGIDFGTTTINFTNAIQLAKAGAVITAAGRFSADKIQVTCAGQTTPVLDFSAGYDLTVDGDAHTAALRGLTLAGSQNGHLLLSAKLSQPMKLAWGGDSQAVGNSEFDLNLSGLKLADWKAFLGPTAPSGVAGLNLKVSAQNNGRRIALDVDSQLQDLAVQAQGDRTIQASMTLQAHAQATDFKQFNLSGYRFQVTHQNEPVLTVTASGTCDLSTTNADARLGLQLSLVRLFAMLEQPDLKATSGSVDFKAHLVQKPNTQTVTGNLVLAGLSGRAGQSRFDRFGSTVDLAIDKTPQQVQITRLTGDLTQAGKAGGDFNLSGAYGLADRTVQLTARLLGLNQVGLGPFLQPLLGDKQLVSIALNGNASVRYRPGSDSEIKSDLQVSDLVVNDPQRKIPATPLEAKLALDAALQKQSADLRQLLLTLTPTDRAR